MTAALVNSIRNEVNHATDGTEARLNRGRRSWIQPVLCCLVFLACITFTKPFVDSPFNDDWSYSDVALRFAQTGRFHYNGWGSPMLLLQTLWGAAWIRVFGFSFDVLRAATLPFSTGFVLLVYALGGRVGIGRGLALFGALTVGTSPLFLPLASSFMTDVYGSFFLLACVYAAIACAQAQTIVSMTRWLWVLALCGIAGGSDRQIVWVAPLLLIPYLGWRRRFDRRFAFHAIAAYTLCLAALALLVSAFSQPYAPLELSRDQIRALVIENWFVALALIAVSLLTGALVALPALLCLSTLWKKLNSWEAAKCGLISAVVTAFLRIFATSHGLAPFLGNLLTPFGIMWPGQDGLGFRPLILPLFLRVVVTCLLLFSAAAFFYLWRRAPALSTRDPLLVFAIVSCPYILLMVPGALMALVYDRYMLPLFPLFVIMILRKFQPLVPSVPAAGWSCLIVFAIYSVATTHDYYSGLRARARAAQIMEIDGIARNRISAGFEFDGWTQVRNSGTIQAIHNNERIEWNTADKFVFWAKTPAITPDYVASYWPAEALPSNRLATVAYGTWFPPFRRAVVVLKRSDLPKGEVNSHAK